MFVMSTMWSFCHKGAFLAQKRLAIFARIISERGIHDAATNAACHGLDLALLFNSSPHDVPRGATRNHVPNHRRLNSASLSGGPLTSSPYGTERHTHRPPHQNKTLTPGPHLLKLNKRRLDSTQHSYLVRDPRYGSCNTHVADGIVFLLELSVGASLSSPQRQGFSWSGPNPAPARRYITASNLLQKNYKDATCVSTRSTGGSGLPGAPGRLLQRQAEVSTPSLQLSRVSMGVSCMGVSWYLFNYLY